VFLLMGRGAAQTDLTGISRAGRGSAAHCQPQSTDPKMAIFQTRPIPANSLLKR
jgi:hypothetical protein